MFGQRSANSNHEFDRAAILASVIRVNIRFDSAPLLRFVVNDHAARLRWVGIFHLLAINRFLIRALQLDVPQKRRLVLVDAHAVGQPVLVTAQPGQQGRQVALAAFGIRYLINSDLDYLVARLEPGSFGVLWPRGIKIRGITRRSRHRLPNRAAMIAQRLLDIFGIGLDLINQARVNLPDDNSAVVPVDEEVNKLLSIQAQLGAEVVDALVHPILWMMPEGIEHSLHASVISRDHQPLAEHKASCQLNDGKSQGIRIIRFIALIMNLKVNGRNDIFLIEVVGETTPVIVFFAT